MSKKQKLIHCYKKPNLDTVHNSTDCLFNLFQGNTKQIKNTCDFRFLTNELKPHLIQISDTELLVYQTPIITMQCKSFVSELKGCNVCVINIPCHCTVLTQTNKFLSHVASCDSTYQTVTRLHLINLACLQHFFSEDIVGYNLANTTFKQIVDVKNTSFKIYKYKTQIFWQTIKL